MKRVAIIGGSGFIGSYITKKFLANNYKVRVSSTDISNKEKYRHLMTLPNTANLEVKPLDVRDAQALEAFAGGCEIVVHSGTPFQLDVKDPQSELFDPTVNGTENFLRVVSESPSVKKVVFVASVAAHNTNFPLPAGGRSHGHVYTENDEPFIDEASHPYAQAKFHADQAVRKFVSDHRDAGFEIVSVSPVFVAGPPLSARQDSTSVGLQYLIKNKIAPNPFIQMFYDEDVEFALVDVADVAEGVFKAATTNGLHGKNYLLSSESWRTSDMNRMLNNEPPKGTSRTVYSGALAQKDLGIRFRPAQATLNEYANMPG